MLAGLAVVLGGGVAVWQFLNQRLFRELEAGRQVSLQERELYQNRERYHTALIEVERLLLADQRGKAVGDVLPLLGHAARVDRIYLSQCFQRVFLALKRDPALGCVHCGKEGSTWCEALHKILAPLQLLGEDCVGAGQHDNSRTV